MEKVNWHIEASFGYITGGGRSLDTVLKLKTKVLRGGTLTQEEAKRLTKVAKGGHELKVLSFLATTAVLESKSKNVAIQFRNFNQAKADLFEVEATMARKRGGWGWDRGIKLKATKNSTYIPDIS